MVASIALACFLAAGDPQPASLGDEIRGALKVGASARGAAMDDAANRLLQLHQRVVVDTEIAPRERERLRRSIEGRLATLAERIHRREQKEATRPATVALQDGHGAVLAQQAPAANPPPAPAPPAQPNGQQDYGDELVELIINTIAPETWDRNGGNGSIYYYRQWQCLVVRQSDVVHRRLGRLALDLRGQ